MRHWTDQRIAGAAGAELVRGVAGRGDAGPSRVVIDSRAVAPGDLFVAIPGERVDGGQFAADALRAGAWGVIAQPVWAREAAATADAGVVIAAEHPVAALGALARAWRQDLAAHVIAVTGSVGKTSTKDLIAALIAPHRTVAASRANFNTEIGLPLEVLAAPPGTEVLVLELGMRGFGQIAELTAICEPDVGVITNIGPVHLEQMGSLEGVAEAKAELLVGMRDGGVAVVPSDEPLLEPYLRDALDVVTFGPGGDVSFEGSSLRGGTVPDAPPDRHVVIARGERIELELPFGSRHNLRNTLAAVAAARGVGVRPGGRVDVRFSALRGERVALGRGATVVNDCYNANPLSMRAALDDLATQQPAGRRVAVLGDMLELGPAEAEHHREIGAYAATAGVDVLIAVGPRSRAMLERFDGEAFAADDARVAAELADRVVRAGDVVLVKASRGVGLEVVAEALGARGRRLMGEVLIGGTASLLICIFLSPKFIAFLRRREFGQQIREEGPQEHHAKAGTPTMGGLIIFTAIAVPFLMLSDFDPRAVGVLGVALACAALGFADDYMKLIKKRSLGLQGRWKLIITMAIAVALWLMATEWADLSDKLDLRVIDATIDLGILYPVLIYLVVAGTTSAVNLTDGLDGLAAGCSAIVLLAYIAITFTTRQTDLALVTACLVGACVGFLWFNSFPASIFMGDTGSLGLGGAIAALAVMTKTEVLLILMGGIFVIEALSVLVQVFSFQVFRKRVFLMAPIHHHFELKAWSETKIILRFWIVAAVCSAVGFTLYQQSLT